MGFWKVISALGATGIAASVVLNAGEENQTIPTATVERVIDGDTIDVRSDGQLVRVRLLNVDTPEIGRDGKPSECLALEAKAYLTNLLPVGSRIDLYYDVETHDNFGRALAAVYKDGKLVNSMIAMEGFGTPMRIGSNDKFYSLVQEATDYAKYRGIGVHALGAECTISNSGLLDPIKQAQETLKLAKAQNFLNLSDNADVKAVSDIFMKIDFAVDLLHRLREDVTAESIRLADAEKKRWLNEIDTLIKELEDERSHIDTAFEREHDRRADAASPDSPAADDEMNLRSDTPSDHSSQLSQWNDDSNPPVAEAPAYTPAPQPLIQPKPIPAPAAPIDTYTGCRAYGGNYAFNSIDNQGRPYAKIDCTTKQQIG